MNARWSSQTKSALPVKERKMELTKDKVKALIFVKGLGDEDRDLRERCLWIMEEAKQKNNAITFAT